ncbi:MAG: hypothetical protein R3290_13810, partial [Acidimicrobiia bacterium]|nr:hypothetical protein [Acidimicrobiia bacterium]
SSGVFDIENDSLPGAPSVNPTIVADVTLPTTASRVQVNPPRDPFDPIVTSTTSAEDTTSTTDGTGDTTTTTAGTGDTTTTTSGGTATTSTTAPGSSTTTTVGDDPDDVRVTLIEVRGDAGSREAVVEVDGTTYTVGVGDTFAVDFRVVSLTENGGVFEYRDQAFSLVEGQAVLK